MKGKDINRVLGTMTPEQKYVTGYLIQEASEAGNLHIENHAQGETTLSRGDYQKIGIKLQEQGQKPVETE